MPNTVTRSQAAGLIDELKEMAAGKTDAVRLGEVVETAHRMDEAGQFVEACNVLGMAAALGGDSFEVERRFNDALRRGGNDAWTLGNYAAALNILAAGFQSRACEASCRQAWDGLERRRPQFFDAMPGYFYTLLHRPDGSYDMPLACNAIRDLYGLGPEIAANDYPALLALVHPDDAATRQRKLDESERDLTPFHAEYRIVLPKKGERWIEAHALPRRMAGGTRWDGFMHDITERKRMEETLAVRARESRQQAQFLQSLLSGMRDAGIILVVVENGHFVYTNDHYVGCQLGYAEGQLPGTVSFIELIHPDDRPRIVEMHRDRLAGKPVPSSYEIGALGGDGSRREYEFHVTLVPDSDPPQTLLLALDIAERKRTEMELQRREREFRTLAENLPDVVVRYDRECRRIYVNPAWEKANGIAASDVIGKSPQELSVRVKPISADFERMLRGVMDSGRADSMVLNWRDETGKPVSFELRAIPEFDSHGNAVSVLTVARDISEHRRMESELALREQAYRSLTENLPDNIARMDAAGRVLYSNPTHQHSLGKPAAEMLGKTFGELFPDGRYAPVERAIAQVVATGQPVLFVRQPVPMESGEPRIHDVNLVPERDANGNVISVLGIGRDMTELYRLQDEIGARERQLRALADSSPGMMGAFYARPDGSVCMPYVSPNIEELFGLRPQDVADDAALLLALNHPDDAQRVSESIAESARNMTVWHEEYRIIHPTRGERWMESHTRPQPHPDGGVVWYGYVHDITGRKRIEHVLRRSEEMLADAQKIAQLGSWDWDVAGDRVEWSEVAYEIYTPDQRPAEPGFEDFKASVHPDDLERVVAAVQSAFERDTPFDLDHRVVSASKGVRTVHAQGKVFRDANGKPVRMVGTVQDITERKRIENVLRFIADPGNVENAEGFLAALARFLGEELGVRYVLIDRLAGDPRIAETVAVYADGGIVPNMRYALKDTPCDNVIGKSVCCYPQGVQALFPQDGLLAEMGAESYAGIPLWDSTGKPAGLIAVMDDAPFVDAQALVNILQLAGPRVAAELERERSERIIRAREQEFRSLAENSPDNIARWDTEGRLRYSNPVHQRSLGKSAAEMMGKTHGELFPDGRFAEFEATMARIVASGEGGVLERVQVPGENGEMLQHEVKLVPEFDADGKVTGVLGLGRDMTDIYLMQETIAAREQEFRSLAESSPDYIVRYDCDGRHRYLNITLLRMLGVSSIDEVAGMRPSDAWPDGRFDQLEQAAARAVETGQSQTIELSVPFGDGGIFYHQIVVVPERDAIGQIVGTIAFGRDVTAIRETERKLAHFIDNLPGLAYTFHLSQEGQASFSYVSQAVEEIYGLKPEEARGDFSTIHMLAHPDDRPVIEAAIAESARTTTPFRVETRVCRPGQPERWLDVRSVPEAQQDGILWYGLMLDITERKRAEHALEDSRIQLRGLIAQREEAREEERRYIAREIHDNLGQILGGLRLSLFRFARRHAADSAEMQDHLRDAGELVDLAVREVRNISAALRPVELEMDIRSALASHLERFGAYSGIECELNAGDDIVSMEEDGKLALFRIAQESLTNIARHSQAGKVEIGLRMEPPYCILYVRDDGIGFDTGVHKPKSFGLTSMRERAAALGGSVVVDSGPGKGTEITVRIPVQKNVEKS